MPTTDPAPQTAALGPLEIGVFLAFALFGVTTTQIHTYLHRFPEDAWQLKLLVLVVWLLETLHLGAVAHAAYTASVVNYDRPSGIIDVPMSICVAFFANGVISAVIQAFFGLRIFRLSVRYYKIVPFFIWFLAVGQFVLAFLPILANALMGPTALADFLTEQNWSVYSTMAISVVCDFAIVFGLVYHLWSQRIFARSRTLVLVDKLIAWTIETGIVTSTAAALELILFCTNALDYNWLAVDCLLSGLFANTLLASLNARATLRELDRDTNVIDLDLSNIQGTSSTRTVLTPDLETSKRQPHSTERLSLVASKNVENSFSSSASGRRLTADLEA
ncbi:hypothetical protein HMN09_01147300 [Mycena chlorophos]|uniref:DUF6534 domain-containing protein n=1 Tax=Mycena chlorophos TaxID=658473 RepID=A0A8H6VZT4_MYCCL|nr:hypothetical protein HMN09_01147300 [Mycena chlorophos]